MYILTGLVLILIIVSAGVLLHLFSASSAARNENQLVPVSILLVTDNLPATRAFLEYYASQIAWMDSCILKCMLLIYPEDSPEIQALCEDMSREYDFFTACSVEKLHHMLDEIINNR